MDPLLWPELVEGGGDTITDIAPRPGCATQRFGIRGCTDSDVLFSMMRTGSVLNIMIHDEVPSNTCTDAITKGMEQRYSIGFL